LRSLGVEAGARVPPLGPRNVSAADRRLQLAAAMWVEGETGYQPDTWVAADPMSGYSRRLRRAETTVQLITNDEAAARTDDILALMPESWRDPTIAPHAMDVANNEAVLKHVSRAVPLSLLLDDKPGGLPSVLQSSELSSAHYFLSTPARQFLAFVSHNWGADPKIVTALLFHVLMPFATRIVGSICLFAIVSFVIYAPIPSLLLAILPHAMMVVLYLTHKSPWVSRALGFDAANLWLPA